MKNNIDFIIITYNRPEDCLELLKNIVQLNHASILLNKLIVVNNASPISYASVEAWIDTVNDIDIVYNVAPDNYGVTGGRNYAMQFSNGELLVFIDDDALLQHPDTLHNIQQSFVAPGYDDRPVAIVSFRVLYYPSLVLQRNALVHKNIEKYKDKKEFFTYYFAGGAHVITKEALRIVGKLPDDFFYGMEEYDLSYRLIERGYCLKCDSSIVMLHKESPLGRKPKKEKIAMMWFNKSRVAWRYLPLRYFYTTAFMWGINYLKETNFDIIGCINTLFTKIVKIPTKENRTPISKKAIEYCRKTEARLWY